MCEEKKLLEMDNYEQGVVIHALNALRTGLMREGRTTDAVDELLLKAIDAPSKKRGLFAHKKARNEER